ncbi:hypothetical protein FACS18948_7080 [Clostridia bacterium]|nr:hypothetical protein FACS18948_7080 [Clostridia bacterium]
MLPNEPRIQTTEHNGTARAVNTALLRFLRSFKGHWQFKSISVIIAVIVWIFLTFAGTEMMVEKVITGVDVSMVGSDTLRGRGYTISEDMTQLIPKVTITVKVPWRNFTRVTGATYAPRLDLSELRSEAGQQTLTFRASASAEYGEVVSFEPKEFYITVEPYKSKNRIPVTVKLSGTSHESLWISEPVVDPAYVTVAGPASLVDQVRRAEAEIMMEDLTEGRQHDTKLADITLVDATGLKMSSSLFRITSESVTVTSAQISVDVYPMIELPVDRVSATVGTPAHGYELASVQLTPSTVQVAGSRAVLDRLKTIFVDSPKNITNATESAIDGSGLRVSPELKYISASEVVIQALIRPATHTHTFQNIPITVSKLAPGFNAYVHPVALNVTVSGNYLDVEKLMAASIMLEVDATDMAAGQHVADVLVRINDVRNMTYSLQQDQVTVIVTDTDAEADAIVAGDTENTGIVQQNESD